MVSVEERALLTQDGEPGHAIGERQLPELGLSTIDWAVSITSSPHVREMPKTLTQITNRISKPRSGGRGRSGLSADDGSGWTAGARKAKRW